MNEPTRLLYSTKSILVSSCENQRRLYDVIKKDITSTDDFGGR